jgi:hypothetical protein
MVANQHPKVDYAGLQGSSCNVSRIHSVMSSLTLSKHSIEISCQPSLEMSAHRVCLRQLVCLPIKKSSLAITNTMATTESNWIVLMVICGHRVVALLGWEEFQFVDHNHIWVAGVAELQPWQILAAKEMLDALGCKKDGLVISYHTMEYKMSLYTWLTKTITPSKIYNEPLICLGHTVNNLRTCQANHTSDAHIREDDHVDWHPPTQSYWYRCQGKPP